MNVFVSRDGQTFGPYTVQQAKQFVGTGQLLSTDFALLEGESEWKTLGNLIGLSDQAPTSNAQPQEGIQTISAVKKKASSANRGKKIQSNRAQSTVVIKERGIFSKIISTIIVFSATCLLVTGVVVGLYFALPDKVIPILSKFGFTFNEKRPEELAGSKAKIQEESTSPLEMTLNDEELQRLRSTNVILLATEKGDGFRILSPVDKDQGLNDEDLEALIPISNQILTMDLAFAEISDRGVALISKFINLQRLYLEGNKKITLNGISKLKDLKNLSYLNLVRVKLDEGLVDLLISMESLREIYLFETGLSKDSISRLINERPKVFVNGG